MLNGAAPAFDLQCGVGLALIRAVWLACLFSSAGALAVCVLVAPAAWRRAPAAVAVPTAARLHRLARRCLLAAVGAGAGWMVLQTAIIAEATAPGEVLAALPPVAGQTVFGHVLLAQLAATVAAWLVLGARPRHCVAALLLACTAIVLQAGHGHGASMRSGAGLLPVADAMHVLAAALWLGGLLPLLLLVRDTPPSAGAAAARRFATLGKACVAGLIVSAMVQAWTLIGTVPALLGTAYGWIVALKLALLGGLLWFAARNRYRLAPALLRGDPERARRRLVRSIAVQTGFGLATILAATVLTGLPPAMHEQPVWPFAYRLSLEAVSTDPAFRTEALAACGALIAAVLLLAAATRVRRRLAWPMVALAALIAWVATPHLDLLLAEAQPMEYFHSPTDFAATSIMHGMALYPQRCAFCHGAEGRGDGRATVRRSVPPADLTAEHLWQHSDGTLFGYLSNGIAAPDGSGPVMPSFAALLTDDERWALIDAIRARNAGFAYAAGRPAPTLPAPAFAFSCGDDAPRSLTELRGRVVRVAIGVVPPPVPGDPLTILAAPAPADHAAAACRTEDPTVGPAYALATGLSAAQIVGAQFLIDRDGLLRAAQPAGASPPWSDPAVLARAIDSLSLPPATPAMAGMQM